MKLTAVALFRVGAKYLCVTRKDDPSKVCFPGGHVDPGDFRQEGLLDNRIMDACARAAIRELREETGVEADCALLRFTAVDDSGNLCSLFACYADDWTGLLKPEPGTECLALTREEFMERCAFPEWYRAALEGGAM